MMVIGAVQFGYDLAVKRNLNLALINLSQAAVTTALNENMGALESLVFDIGCIAAHASNKELRKYIKQDLVVGVTASIIAGVLIK
jgi:hypothetical protein